MNRTAAGIMFALTSSIASAAIVVNPEVVFPVPLIHQGLDWSIMFIPEPRIERETLSAEDVRQILPPAMALGLIKEVVIGGPIVPSGKSAGHPIIVILTLTVLLLVGYGFIPGIHSQVLRSRSINLNRDLFT